MANTGNTQQIINYGASPNDGQGDPLRTAFIKTDENFDNVWLAGPVGSNITIVNNTIGVQNTNGNLILKPNGIGVIQANASVVPNATDLRDLGTSDLKWRSAAIGSGGITVDGDVTIAGNLTAEIQTTPVQLANLTATAGGRAFISDGNLAAAGNFGAQIAGGGANLVPVWSDGTNWYVG